MLKLLLHGVGSYGPGELVGPADWPHHDLIVVTDGRVDFALGKRTLSCQAGDALLVTPGRAFHGVVGAEGASIWVQHFAVGRGCPVVLPQVPTCWRGVGQWEWPRTLMRRLSRVQKSRGEVIADKARSMVLVLLLEEFRAGRVLAGKEALRAEQTVSLVIDWIEHHDLPLPSVKEIAAFAGWSVNYFRDQFRAVSGHTVGDFLKQRRMGEAARLLMETRRPIKEIAMSAGYAEVASFHRAFCERYRMTPGRYRDQRMATI